MVVFGAAGWGIRAGAAAGPEGAIAGAAIGGVSGLISALIYKNEKEAEFMQELKSGKYIVKSDIWVEQTKKGSYKAKDGHLILKDPTWEESG
jgi:hypothetical protein